MLSCFIDYIGLNTCVGAYDSSPSGQYINTLPGLTLENIDKIAEPTEQKTYRGVWAGVQNEASSRFYLDVVRELRKCTQVSKECDYEAMFCDEDNRVLLTNAWKYLLGVQLMTERIYSSRINRFTTVDRDKAKELREMYQAEYMVYLEQAVQLLDTSSCELCCGGNPEYVTWLP